MQKEATIKQIRKEFKNPTCESTSNDEEKQKQSLVANNAELRIKLNMERDEIIKLEKRQKDYRKKISQNSKCNEITVNIEAECSVNMLDETNGSQTSEVPYGIEKSILNHLPQHHEKTKRMRPKTSERDFKAKNKELFAINDKLSSRRENLRKFEKTISQNTRLLESFDIFEVSSFTRLLMKEFAQCLIANYKEENGHTIFGLVFEMIHQSNAKHLIRFISELLQILNNFNPNQIVDLVDYDLPKLFKKAKTLPVDLENQILKLFIPHMKVEGADSYSDFREIFMVWPELQIFILAKENRTQEFQESFEIYLNELKENFAKPIKEDNEIKEETAEKELDGTGFQKLLDDCKALAKIAQKNVNEEILRFLALHSQIDLQIRLNMIIYVCKSGFHKTLKIFLESEESKMLSNNVAKTMMFAVFEAIMTCRQEKTFKEVYYNNVNHNSCFNHIFKNKEFRKNGFIFMKQALLNRYDEIVKKFFQNGYYIARKNDKDESFLSICENPDLFEQILDGCVTLKYSDNTLKKKCIKIDYRFMEDSMKKKTQTDQKSYHMINEEKEPAIKSDEKERAQLSDDNFLEPIKKACQDKFSFWYMLCWSLLVLSVIWSHFLTRLSSENVNYLILPYLLCPFYVVLRNFYQMTQGWCYFKSKCNAKDILIVISGLLAAICLENDKSIHDCALIALLMSSTSELLLIISKIRGSMHQYGQEAKPLELIAQNDNFKKSVKHPVLANYIDLMYRKFETMNRFNFWCFTLLWILMLISVVFSESLDTIGVWIKYVFYILCPVYICFRETFQIFWYGDIYFKAIVNWMEFFLAMCGFIGIQNYLSDNRLLFYKITAILIMLTVIEILLLLAKLRQSVFLRMSMFKNVAIMYGKFIRMFAFILIGFTISFSLFFRPPLSTNDETKNEPLSDTEQHSQVFNNFKTYPYSFLKVFIMLTGEFDASSIVLSTWYKFIFFVIFVFVAVTIFNFMNALAIGEVQDLKDDAEFFILQEKLNKICIYEKILDRFDSFPNFTKHILNNIFFKFSERIKNLNEVYIECIDNSISCNSTTPRLPLYIVDEKLSEKLELLADKNRFCKN